MFTIMPGLELAFKIYYCYYYLYVRVRAPQVLCTSCVLEPTEARRSPQWVLLGLELLMAVSFQAGAGN